MNTKPEKQPGAAPGKSKLDPRGDGPAPQSGLTEDQVKTQSVGTPGKGKPDAEEGVGTVQNQKR